MIISDKISIEIKRGNIGYFRDNYKDIKIGDFIEVDIENISKGSNYIIEAKCHFCGEVSKIKYKLYNNRFDKHGNFACGRKCASKRNKRKLQDVYGVDNISQVPYVKDKIKKTNLERYGSEYYISSIDCREKTKKKLINKYGVDNPQKSEEIQKRTKKTNLERYGVEYILQNRDVIEKTNLEKYGYKVASKSDKVKNKIKETNQNKYGHNSPIMDPEILKKSKDTLMENWGVDNPQKSEEIQKRTKKTNLERYGVEYPSQSEEIKQKMKLTCQNRYGVEYISQSEKFKDIIKNSSLERYGVESYLLTNDFKNKSKNTILDKYGSDNITKSEKFRKSHYEISNDKNYIKYLSDKKSLFKCDCGKDHNFVIKSDNYIHRKSYNNKLCTICYPINDLSSIKEKELVNYLKNIYDGIIIENYRDDLEIDIYLPGLNIGFEFNGLYYHSDKFKDKNYHIDKTNYFKDKGIRIIHIWEDDWVYKTDIIKSQIRNLLGMSEKIYARKCVFKKVNKDEFKKFLGMNHLQGQDRSLHRYGLYYDNRLVSIMTFDKFAGRFRMGEREWNLSRFCNKLNVTVIGGASKLLKNFIKNHNPKKIISYADNDWSEGNLYDKLSFNKISLNSPDYKYVVNNKRRHKSNYKKSKLGISGSKITESQYMSDKGYHRIWDCGKIKYEMVIK